MIITMLCENAYKEVHYCYYLAFGKATLLLPKDMP